MLGFGSGDKIQGVPDPPRLLSVEEDIRLIRLNTAPTPVFLPFPIQFTTTAQIARIDLSQMLINSMIVSVASGTLLGWIGDGSQAPLIPFIRVLSTIGTQQFDLPLGEYVFNFGTGGGTPATGMITFLAK